MYFLPCSTFHQISACFIGARFCFKPPWNERVSVVLTLELENIWPVIKRLQIHLKALQHLLNGLQGLRVFLLRLFDLGEAAAANIHLSLRLEGKIALWEESFPKFRNVTAEKCTERGEWQRISNLERLARHGTNPVQWFDRKRELKKNLRGNFHKRAFACVWSSYQHQRGWLLSPHQVFIYLSTCAAVFHSVDSSVQIVLIFRSILAAATRNETLWWIVLFCWPPNLYLGDPNPNPASW